MEDVFSFKKWKCIAQFKTNKTATMSSLKIPFLYTYAYIINIQLNIAFKLIMFKNIAVLNEFNIA